MCSIHLDPNEYLQKKYGFQMFFMNSNMVCEGERRFYLHIRAVLQ